MKEEDHDEWSKMGEGHLGEMNIQWGEKVGWDILMKSIMNDYWADANTPTAGWPKFHVDMVMSKLYYCWVRQLDDKVASGEVQDE